MTTRKIQPAFLKPGDKVAIISPSSYIGEDLLIEAVAFLEKWGLKVRTGKNAAKRNGPFAGNDEERLNDLQEMTSDPDIKAVFCSRGGYGLLRIINRVDFSALNKSPKWYAGFSDITILHTWLNDVCGVISIHGEMPVNFHNSVKTNDTFVSLKQALFGELGSIEWEGNFFRYRDVSGELTGGNLSLLYSLMGSRAELITRGKILFIEEVGECYYHVDRMLTSLKLAGKLDELSALVVGGMNEISESKIPWGKNIEKTILDIVSEYNYPLLFSFPAGHVADNRAFYIGKQAKIEVNSARAILSYI